MQPMSCHTPSMSPSYSHKSIESVQNPRVKALSLLKNRREREREQQYLIEGVREVRRALAGWAQVKQVLFCPKLLADASLLLDDGVLGEMDRLELSQRAFEKLSLQQNPDGLMALATMTEATLPVLSENKQANALILILDSVEKPGNVGALLRTADAVAADAVFLIGDGTDMYNPNVIRASMGSLFARPVVMMPRQEMLEYCQEQQLNIVVSSPHASQSYWQSDLRGRVALVLGNEARGLDDRWLQSEHTRVTIPMLSPHDDGLADSLNVATAGALLLYEVLRQNSQV